MSQQGRTLGWMPCHSPLCPPHKQVPIHPQILYMWWTVNYQYNWSAAGQFMGEMARNEKGATTELKLRTTL